MGIGKRIKEARISLNLTQEELANLLGITKGAVANYENETSHPKEPIMYKLFNALHVDANYLFQDEMGNNYPMKVSYDEMEHIKKYRLLDEAGRNHVDMVLSWELERIESAKPAPAATEIPPTPHRVISYYQRLASAGTGEYLFDSVPVDMIEVPVTGVSEQADFVIGVNGSSMEPTYCNGDKVYVQIADEIPNGEIGIFVRGNDCFIKELGADRLISHNADKKTYPDIPAGEDIRLVGKVLGKVEDEYGT